MIIGCYTADMDGAGTGFFVAGGETVAAASPSYLVGDERFVYAVNEGAGTVSSYARETLALLSTAPTGGRWPCHLALHPDGFVIVANYGSGNVSVHPVADGVLSPYTDLVQHEGHGPDAGRQEGPHAHQIVVSPDGSVTVADLGIDRLVHYRLADGRLTATGGTVLPPGTGPRHIAGRYVVGELSSTVVSLADLTAARTTASGGDNFPSAIVAGGDLLYVANRGANTIAVLETEPALKLVAEVPCGGEWPRDLVLDGDVLRVANQNSGTVVTFTAGRDPQPTGEVLDVPSPACILL